MNDHTARWNLFLFIHTVRVEPSGRCGLSEERGCVTDGQKTRLAKDLSGWWQNLHYDRPNGVRSRQATAWVPGSKPIWFTEYGCAALDRATNQPNKFLDAMSSESTLPHYSNGQRDDSIQAAHVLAVTS